MQAIIRKVKELTFSEKLYQLRQKLGVTQEELSAYFDLKLRMYANYERGDMVPTGIKRVKYEKIIKNLESGNLPPLKSKERIAFRETEFDPKPNTIYVPIEAWGGFMHGYADPVFIDSLKHGWEPGLTGMHYIWPVKGWSMFKKGDDWSAKPGDLLYSIKMEGLKDLLKDNAYVIQSTEGIAYKIFDRTEANKVYFKSLNEDEDGAIYPVREIKGIYFVDWIRRKT
jgi:transcriptional regulator with XRE-family HTH domain